MKPIFVLFILCSLLLVANLSHARKDQLGEYWKNMMNGQPMPKAIKELVQDPQVSDTGTEKDRFIRDFDIKPNIILYHTHLMSKSNQNQKLKPFAKNFEPASHETETHG